MRTKVGVATLAQLAKLLSEERNQKERVCVWEREGVRAYASENVRVCECEWEWGCVNGCAHVEGETEDNLFECL